MVLRVNEATVALTGATRDSIHAATNRMPPSFLSCLARMVLATHNHEPILLVGPTACKSTLVSAWCTLFNRSQELETCFLSPETEAGDLIGQMHPYTPYAALKE
eukprot:27610-Eustigmatos_ZCMA.PRE.1